MSDHLPYEMTTVLEVAGSGDLRVSVRPYQKYVMVETRWQMDSSYRSARHCTISLSNYSGKWVLVSRMTTYDDDDIDISDPEYTTVSEPSPTLLVLITTFHHGRAWQPLLDNLVENYSQFAPFAVYWAKNYGVLDELVRAAFPPDCQPAGPPSQ